MKLHDVGNIYPELKKFLDKFQNFDLYPPQEEAIKKGVLEKNFILASGTATGKSLIAYLAALKAIANNNKVFYLVPLRALAFEKARELKDLDLGINILMLVGDFTEKLPKFNYDEIDVFIFTYEKADSILRNNPSILQDVSLMIFDEIHEMNRRPVIETLLTKFKDKKQILGLSATIGNVEEIAKWIHADYVISDFRPVKLIKAWLNDKELYYDDKKVNKNLDNLIEEAFSGKELLIFVNSRKEAENLALKIAEKNSFYFYENQEKLKELSKNILNVLNPPTEQCKKLADVVLKGVAFHHAGLVNKQRLLIEDAFKEGILKILVATPTLVAGVNLPSKRVVVKEPNPRIWTVSLFKQAIGRAGRPGFSEEGEGIIYTKSAKKAEKYLQGKPEPIVSSLAFMPILRREILGLIASSPLSFEDLRNYASRTFYAHQYGNPNKIIALFLSITRSLTYWNFVEYNEVLSVTKLGKRVAQLYIDPYSAHLWLDNYKDSEILAYLHLMSYGWEVDKPKLTNEEKREYAYLLEMKKNIFLIEPPSPWDYDFDLYLRTFKLALAYNDWINEVSEKEILEKYRIAPGDFRITLSNMVWMAYSFREVLKAAKIKYDKRIDLLELRLSHGLYEDVLDLLELMVLPRIGRVKARKLKSMNLSIEDILEMDKNALIKLLGPKTGELVYLYIQENRNLIDRNLKLIRDRKLI